MKQNRYFYILCVILILKAVFMIAFISTTAIGLGPDEAQYWTWSQQLDWGYYSKPPAIAWQIWAGTKIFGNTELGVRFFAVAISFFLSLTVYFLGLICKTTPKTAFWAALVIAFSPIGLLSSFLAITDGGMVLCWALATLVFSKGLAEKKSPHYFILGFILLVGALFKWPIYPFWVFVLIFCWFYPYLRSKTIILGVLISLLGLIPSVIWNASHDWVTFRHVFATVFGSHLGAGKAASVHSSNFFEFLGSQFVLFSPLLFVMLLISFVVLLRDRQRIPPAILFSGITALGTIAGYALLALVQKIQGNWCDLIYPNAALFVAWVFVERFPRVIWVKIGTVLSVILCLFSFSIPLIQSLSLFPSLQIPYKSNPFKHNLGWDNLTQALVKVGYDPKENFLFGDKYQTASILSFYGPNQKRAYFLNLHEIRLNQFSFWPSMANEQKGKTGFFVLTENSPHFEKDLSLHKEFYEKNLQKYFAKVESFPIASLFESYGKTAKIALIFKCVDYNGKEPSSSGITKF